MVCSTLENHMARFLSIKYNPQTRRWYKNYLRSMLQFLGAERQLDSIERSDAEAYWQWLQSRTTCWETHPYKPTEDRSLSPTTLHNHLRAARVFWNEMVRQRLVDYNPFDHIRSPKDTRPVEMKAISPDDLRAIWHAARSSSARDYAIITVMATSGVRAGELVSMNLQQINLKTGEAWVEGKRGWRKVFLGELAVRALEEYTRERPLDSGSALWINQYGGALTTDGVRQLVDRLAEKAEVDGRHNLHSFRHRMAQAWLDNGINPEIVAQALGHKDVTVTLHIYGNQDNKRLREAMHQVEKSPFLDPYGLD